MGFWDSADVPSNYKGPAASTQKKVGNTPSSTPKPTPTPAPAKALVTTQTTTTPDWQSRLKEYAANPAAGYAEIERAKQVYAQQYGANNKVGYNAANTWANQVRDAIGINKGSYDGKTGAVNGQYDYYSKPLMATDPLAAKDAYLSQFQTGITSQQDYLAQAKDIAQGRATLEYDSQIGRLKSLAQQAKTGLQTQLSSLPQQYNVAKDEANQQAYSRQAMVDAILAKSGMMNSGAAAGNTQLVQNDLSKETGKINLAQTTDINALNAKLSDVDTNLASDTSELGRLKDVFISNALAQSQKDYQGYYSDQMGKAEDSFWKGQDSINQRADLNLKADQANSAVQSEQARLESENKWHQMDYDAKIADIQSSIQMNREKIIADKQNVSAKIAQSKSQYDNDFYRWMQQSKIEQSGIDSMRKENDALDTKILAAIGQNQPEIISWLIGTSNLPEEAKAGKLLQIKESMGYTDWGMDKGYNFEQNSTNGLAGALKPNGLDFKPGSTGVFNFGLGK